MRRNFIEPNRFSGDSKKLVEAANFALGLWEHGEAEKAAECINNLINHTTAGRIPEIGVAQRIINGEIE